MASDFRKPRVFVMWAYQPNGGTYMAYHLALILHQDFGFDALVVDGPDADHGMFVYPVIFPKISEKTVVETATTDDIVIANPSFSRYWFGFTCQARKIMYIQHFSTFRLLDCRFDLYITVSGFVQDFIARTYNIRTKVIPPFIHADRFPQCRPWRERPERSILVSWKGDENLRTVVFDRLQRELAARGCDVVLEELRQGGRPQPELLEQIGRNRYFLTLSPSEGFGLLPLEAMAMGATVLGFDGFGGRDYMKSGVNCDVTNFADIEGVADRIVRAVSDPDYAERLAGAGQQTGRQARYTYDHFRDCWRAEFAALLGGKSGGSSRLTRLPLWRRLTS